MRGVSEAADPRNLFTAHTGFVAFVLVRLLYSTLQIVLSRAVLFSSPTSPPPALLHASHLPTPTATLVRTMFGASGPASATERTQLGPPKVGGCRSETVR